MKTIAFNISIAFLLLIAQTHSFSQTNTAFEKFDEYRRNNYQEKIYVSTDREFYLAGEIIWFKVYGMDGSFHLPTGISRIAYVEVISADSTAQLQAKVELDDGVGSGSFFIPTSMLSGRFILRAYTSWMKNYDAGFFFQKELTIVNTFRQLPPISSNDRINLQFYPEGGHLVSGIESNLAFRGSNGQDKGIEFMGAILNAAGDTIQIFSPDHAGMGSFRFTPEAGEPYTAVITAGNDTFRTQLPEVEAYGYVLSLARQDELISVSIETNTADAGVFLLAHSRNSVSHSLHKKLIDGKTTFPINLKELADGINHFTIFNDASVPVAERLYFKHPNKLMSIEVKDGQIPREVREQINYQISTLDHPNANLSMSVYKLDSLNEEPHVNIVSYLYLLSDLVGQIEDPTYYLGEQVPERDTELLMMVHGWSRFSWDEVLDSISSVKKYVPELRGHLIQGKLFHKEDKISSKGIHAYLSVVGDYPRFYISRSDAQGRIKFELQDSYGEADIVFGTNQLVDSLFQIEISDPFSTEYTSFTNHDLNLNERLSGSLVSRSIDMQSLNIYQEENMIRFDAPDSDTSLFFMKVDKRYMLDDFTRFSSMEDIMREYMPEIYVNSNKEGYALKILDWERKEKYDRNPLILYDGIPVFDINKFMAFDTHRIKCIDVVRQRYFYSKRTFDGIISCTSFERDLQGAAVDPASLVLNYEFAQVQRSFYTPDYGTSARTTTPDRRNLLFWKADIVTNEEGIADVEFPTSEETGDFLIVIEGMSAQGIPGYTSFSFEVRDEVN